MKKIFFLLMLSYNMTSLLFAQSTPNNALNFDGVDDCISFPDNDGMSAVTIEAWVYWTPAYASSVQFLCSKDHEQLEIHTGGIGNNGLRFIPTSGVYIDAQNVLPQNAWTHIACVYDPAQSLGKIYINGNVVNSTNNGSNLLNTVIKNTNSPFYLGKRGDGSFSFSGSLDEFRLWNRARTAEEILADYKLSIDASAQAELNSYYKFNQGTASGNNTDITTLTDSKNTYNGTLSGFAFTGNTSNFVAGYVSPNLTTNIFYVKEGGTGDGSSWALASGDLQAVINVAVAGDQVWVAAGTYKPNRPANKLGVIDALNLNNSFVLKKDVKLYGGFSSTGNPEFADRDTISRLSILSGDLAGNDGSNFANNTENAYHVLLSVGDVGTACLDGFTITAGSSKNTSGFILVNGSPIDSYFGGGMYIRSSSPKIRNCNIVRNYSVQTAGGISILSGSPIIERCLIADNIASNSGGGIAIDSKTPIISNCQILRNKATYGGGMYIAQSNAVLTNCLIAQNVTYYQGGGLLVFLAPSPSIVNCTFAGNTGGGQGSEAMHLQSVSPRISNTIISGGVVIQSATPTYDHCLVASGAAPVGTGNLSANPQFTDASTGNFSLASGSPAINAGDNSKYDTNLYGNKDLAGNLRVVGVAIDMGAYEFSPTTSVNSIIRQSVALYPNPAINGFTIEASETPTTLTIHTLTGKLIYTQTVSGKTYVDVSAWQAGVYLVKINGTSVKLVKI